jgi:ABC-type sugar transport system permease subunit/ABC-type glycerol-3-phosphate transport system substrate-binding protein
VLRAAILLFLGLFWLVPARAQEPIVLRVGGAYPSWGIPDPNATSPLERAKRRVFEAFTKKHPEIKLERFTALSIQGPAAESGILMAFAGGTAPDIVYVNMRLMRQYVSQGFLQPVDDLLEKHPETLKRIHPNLTRELDIDGKTYAIPFVQFCQALYYRKDLFRTAGLDPQRGPKDWDEFYVYCQKLYEPQKGQWGYVFPPSDTSYHWLNFLYSAGGDVTRKTPGGSYEAAFGGSEGAAALAFWRKLMTAKWTGTDGKTVEGAATKSATRAADISAGKVGMWFAYQSDDIVNMTSTDINPSLIGIAPMPRGPTGLRSGEINASMWGVNASVKDPKKRAACLELLRFLASDEAAKIRVDALVDNGLAQLVNPGELIRWGHGEYVTAAQKPWLAAQKTLFETGKPEPAGPNMAFIYKLLDEPLDQAVLYPDRPIEKILSDATFKVNRKLLGFTPPDEQARQRKIALGIALTLTLGLFLFTLRAVILAWKAAKIRLPGVGIPLRSHLSAWLFMAPAVLSIALWAYFPLLRGMLMAFQDYRILGGGGWVGLDNFIEAAGQETFWKGITNAFTFTFWLLGLGFLAPVGLALMLHEIPKGKVFFRALYYLPAVTTGVIVAMLWKQFFDPAPTGLANSLLGLLGLQPLKWLQDPALAKFCVVLPLIWAGAGPGSIIYLAALQGIPDEMYEAAELDGAGVFAKIWKLTLPTLAPLLIINLVGATIGAFKIMEPVLVQTGGGPDNATHTIGLEVWYNAFMYLKFGYATAAAWMMGLVLIGLTLYQLKMLQNVRYSAAGK